MTCELKKIPLKLLKVAKTNVRKSFIDSEIDLLVQSMKQEGQADLLVVVPDSDGTYAIIKGQRRFLAAKKLVEQGVVMYDMMCVVKDLDTKGQLKESLMEAVVQKNILEFDTAHGIDDLLKTGSTAQEIQKALGISEERYSYYLGLLGLNPPETLEARAKGETKAPASTTPTKESKTSSVGPTVTSTGKIEDPMFGLTMAQRAEVEARKRENPMQKTQEVADGVRDYYDTTSEFNGLRISKDYLVRFNELAKNTGSTSQKREIEKYLNSKETEEYLKKQGV